MHAIPTLRADGPGARSPAGLILAVVGRQKAATLWGAVTSAVWMTSTALIPAAIGLAIERGIAGDDTGQLLLWSTIVLVAGLVRAGSGIAFYRQSVITHVVSGSMVLRTVTEHATRFGASLGRRHRLDDLLATSTADITAVGLGLSYGGRVFGSVVAVVAVTVTMLVISLPLGLLVLVTVPLLTGLSALLLRPLHDRQDAYRSLQGRLAGRAVDIASGLRVLRGIGGEATFSARFRTGSDHLRLADVDVARSEADLQGARVLVPGLVTVIVTYASALFALDQRLTIGELIMFYGFATSLLMPLTDFMEGMSQVTRSLVGARRVTRLLNDVPPDRGGTGGSAPRAVDGERPALVDSTSGLMVPPSTFTAVACADGTDADLLAHRIAGVEDPGDAALGGERLSSLPVPVVRSRVLLGLNSHRFFTGTIRDELDPDGTADDADVEAALRVACATDVVESRPDGTATRISGGGRTFSGGELQRLRLARVLLRRAEFTVLVEPTNAVDAYTEFRVAENLRLLHDRHGDDRSTVVFTLSPLLLHRADRVAYVEQGTVVASGSHEDLLFTHPGYRALVSRDVVR